jgi:hypothetical protein
VALTLVVAAASPGSPEFAVIDFSNTPPTVVMPQGFDGGNVVDCYGTLAAVAAYSGNSVAIFDISTPALPSKTGSVDTGFQIGSISIYESYVLAGEFEGSRVSLIDVGDPANPYTLGVSDCEPMLNIISSVALRSPTLTNATPRLSAVVSGDNNSVILYFQGNPPTAAVPVPLLYNAWPSDFDGWTAAVANDPNAPGGIQTYALSGNTATPLALVPDHEATGSVAVAEIPDGGYFVAGAGTGSFSVFAYPTNYPMGSIKTALQKGTSSMGTAVKFLNNPAIAPFLAVANVTAGGISISNHLIQVETGLSQGTVVSFFTPIPVAEVALPSTYVPTLGITAFTPVRRFPFPPWPIPGWLEKILRALGL